MSRISVLRQVAQSHTGWQEQPRDAAGRWVSEGGTKAGAAVRRETYKAALTQLAHAYAGSVPHASIAAGLGAAGIEAGMQHLAKKAIGTKQADAILANAGETIGKANMKPEHKQHVKLLKNALEKLPNIAQTAATTQLLGHGIQAVLTHGMHMDPAASAAVAHITAAALQPGVSQGLAILKSKIGAKGGRYATS